MNYSNARIVPWATICVDASEPSSAATDRLFQKRMDLERPPLEARIVVADDFAPIRVSLKALLGDTVCGEAANGQEAVDKVLELHPDLILLDLSMPVKDGFEATREIRVLAPKTKILIFTLYDSASLRAEAFQAGADGFLRKDSPSGEILETVNALVQLVRGDEPTSRSHCQGR